MKLIPKITLQGYNFSLFFNIKDETIKIGAKRKKFEYGLISPQKTKDIFLKYIQFELNLLELIKTRRKTKRN